MAATRRRRPRLVIVADPQHQWSDSPQLGRLREHGEVALHTEAPATPDELAARVRGAEVVVTPVRVQWTAEALAMATNLRLLVLAATGSDSVDLAAARAQGVTVCNVPGRTAPVVAEHALALLLAVARRVVADTVALRAGEWSPQRSVFLAGRTLGVVGTGYTGAAMARLGQAIGMDVVAWTFNPSEERARELGVRYVALDELLAASDAVSLHVRMSGETRHLIGKRELGLMKPGAILVNVARGGVVDGAAVAEALLGGRLGGFGTDVFETEPVLAGDPLLKCENAVLTPHVADNTLEGMEYLNEGTVSNVAAYLAGRPVNVLN